MQCCRRFWALQVQLEEGDAAKEAENAQKNAKEMDTTQSQVSDRNNKDCTSQRASGEGNVVVGPAQPTANRMSSESLGARIIAACTTTDVK